MVGGRMSLQNMQTFLSWCWFYISFGQLNLTNKHPLNGVLENECYGNFKKQKQFA